LGAVLLPVLEKLSTWLANTLPGAVAAVEPYLQRFAAWFSEELAPKIQTAAEAIGSFISDTLESLSGWWDDNGQNIIDLAQTIGEVLSSAFIWVSGVFDDYLKPAFDSITDWVTESPGRLQTLAAVIGGTLAAAFIVWAVSALAAAAATYAALLPLVALVAIVVVATAVTQYLIDKFDLLSRGMGFVGWAFDNIVSPILRVLSYLRQVSDTIDRIMEKAEAFLSLVDRLPGGPTAADDDVLNELYPNAEKEAAGKRAMGGPVSARRPYLVGERGPEMFVPSSAGRIVANRELAMASTGGGGGGTSYTIHVASLDPKAAGKAVVDAIQAFESSNGKGWRSS
jgi:phage-related protein